MKTFMLIVIAGMITFPVSIYAQPRGGQTNYDLKTVETLTGQIVKITKIPGGGNSVGIHLTLKTATESIDVHVGPDWYLAKQSVQLNVNDQVIIKGSKINYNNQPAIIAAEIKKGDETLALRNDQGYPLWNRKNN